MTIGLLPDRNNIPQFLAYLLTGLDICARLYSFDVYAAEKAKALLMKFGIIQELISDKTWRVHNLTYQFVLHTGNEREFYLRDRLARFITECERLPVLEYLFTRLTFAEILDYLEAVLLLMEEALPLSENFEQRISVLARIFLESRNESFLNNFPSGLIIGAQQVLCCAQQVNAEEWVNRSVSRLGEIGHAYFSLYCSIGARTIVWDIQDRAETKIGAKQVAYRDDGFILIVDRDGSSWITDAGEEVTGYSQMVSATAIIGREGRLIGGGISISFLNPISEDYSLVTWLPTNSESEQIPLAPVDNESKFASTINGRWLVIGGTSNQGTYLWDFKHGHPISIFHDIREKFESTVISIDGQTIFAVLKSGGGIRRWSVEDDSIDDLKIGSGSISSLALSADDHYLIAASTDGVLHIADLWNMQSRNGITTLKGHTGEITQVRISDDNSLVVTAGGDHTIRLWDWQGKYLHVKDIQNETKRSCQIAHLAITTEITSLDIAPDGTRIVAGDQEGNVFAWDVIIPAVSSVAGSKSVSDMG